MFTKKSFKYVRPLVERRETAAPTVSMSECAPHRANDFFQVPIGTWAKDPRLKEIGEFHRENMLACISAFTLAPLTRVLVRVPTCAFHYSSY
jgi:hypothetical protein